MQEDYYKILGLSSTATDEQIDAAYAELKKEYKRNMFAEGEKGNEAAENLTRLETAYSAIKSERETVASHEGREENDYSQVETLIKSGDLSGAQAKLDTYAVRDAEWHYLQSIVFYRKNWTNESKKQLEIAIQIEPDNERYKSAYEKLKARMDKTDERFKSGNADFVSNNGEPGSNGGQMGGDFCTTCSDCLTAYCCASMCTSCCCR